MQSQLFWSLSWYKQRSVAMAPVADLAAKIRPDSAPIQWVLGRRAVCLRPFYIQRIAFQMWGIRLSNEVQYDVLQNQE